MSTEQFELWFGNESGRGGQALIYQPTSNASFNGSAPEQLAWMVAGANASVWVRFTWSVDYGFLWIDRANASFQRQPADLQSSNRISLSHNPFGFEFLSPGAGDPAGTLLIDEDGSIPVANQCVAGISMDGAGTLAAGAAPNQTLAFTPVATADLDYLISFGQYDLEVGETVTPGLLNPPATIAYRAGVTVMTATLSSSNEWTISEGASRRPESYLLYQAGVGVVGGA